MFRRLKRTSTEWWELRKKTNLHGKWKGLVILNFWWKPNRRVYLEDRNKDPLNDEPGLLEKNTKLDKKMKRIIYLKFLVKMKQGINLSLFISQKRRFTNWRALMTWKEKKNFLEDENDNFKYLMRVKQRVNLSSLEHWIENRLIDETWRLENKTKLNGKCIWFILLYLWKWSRESTWVCSEDWDEIP